jgi:hypothetical protein
MATRMVFLSGQETAVTGTAGQVVQGVRRGYHNPVELEGIDGEVLSVNWGAHPVGHRLSAGTLGRRSA